VFRPACEVALALQHRQADQGLGAGHEGAAAGQRPFVVQGCLKLVRLVGEWFCFF
jgi:hypothetical protein